MINLIFKALRRAIETPHVYLVVLIQFILFKERFQNGAGWSLGGFVVREKNWEAGLKWFWLWRIIGLILW